MKCNQCGKNIPDHVPYCRYCGARTGEPIPTPQKSPNRIPLVLCACVLALLAGIGLWFWLRPAPSVPEVPQEPVIEDVPPAEPAKEPASVVLAGAAHGKPGDTLPLSADLFPAQEAKRTVWTSSNEAVATVKEGVVICVAPGETTLRVVVTLEDGQVVEDAYILIVDEPEITYEAVLAPEALTLKAGAAEALTLTVTPETEMEVQWQSSNALVAAVTDGRVQAVGEGTAIISATITLPNGKLCHARAEITVVPADPAPAPVISVPTAPAAPANPEPIPVIKPNAPMKIPDVIPPEEEAPAKSDENYLIANSAQAYITIESLKSYSTTDLILARNEIYARRGRRFSLDWIRRYFEGKSWYHATIAPEDFDPKVFNAYELVNLDRIQQVEAARKE